MSGENGDIGGIEKKPEGDDKGNGSEAEFTAEQLAPYLAMDELAMIKKTRSLQSIASRSRAIIIKYQDKAGDITDALKCLDDNGHGNVAKMLKPINETANKRISVAKDALAKAEKELSLMRLAKKKQALDAAKAAQQTAQEQPAG